MSLSKSDRYEIQSRMAAASGSQPVVNALATIADQVHDIEHALVSVARGSIVIRPDFRSKACGGHGHTTTAANPNPSQSQLALSALNMLYVGRASGLPVEIIRKQGSIDASQGDLSQMTTDSCVDNVKAELNLIVSELEILAPHIESVEGNTVTVDSPELFSSILALPSSLSVIPSTAAMTLAFGALQAALAGSVIIN